MLGMQILDSQETCEAVAVRGCDASSAWFMESKALRMFEHFKVAPGPISPICGSSGWRHACFYNLSCAAYRWLLPPIAEVRVL